MSTNQISLFLLAVFTLFAGHGARADSETEVAKVAHTSAAREKAQIDRITGEIMARKQRCAEAQTRISLLSHAQRLRAIAELPSGTDVNLPEFWQSVPTPATLMDAYTVFGEPLSADAVDAAERLLPEAKGYDRFELMVALYRYNRPHGIALFRESVKSHADAKAAAVLAANHDRSVLPNILTMLKARPERYLLTPPLGAWRNAEVQKALLQAFQAHPDDIYLPKALALQRYKPAIPALEAAYHHLKGYPMDGKVVYGSNRTILGAVLISLGSKESKSLIPAYQKELTKSIHSQTMDMDALTLIETAGAIRLKELAPNLEAILEAYCRQTKSDHKQWSEVFAVNAAKSLYAIDHDRAAPKIQELRHVLKARGAEAGDWSEQFQYGLSEIDDDNLDPDDYLRLKGVRKVPNDFLPTTLKIRIWL